MRQLEIERKEKEHFDTLRFIRRRTELEIERRYDLSLIAESQGMVLVPFDNRNFVVICIWSKDSLSNVCGSQHVFMRGNVVFGPAMPAECHDFIAKNTKKVPFHLILGKSVNKGA